MILTSARLESSASEPPFNTQALPLLKQRENTSNVTLGRADVYKSEKDSPSEFKGFLIKEGACICAGAKLICKKGTLVIGKNAVVGANAVLLNSIGDNEIWGGVPARFIGMRETSDNEM